MMIRRMRPEDVAGAAEIERLTFSAPWSEKGFLDALENVNAVFFVAEEEAVNSCGDVASVILGYIGMYVSIDEGEITNVAVGQHFRGGGVGKALIEKILSYAGANQITRIVLEVRVSNAAAIGLYAKYGFAKVGTRKGFYEFPKEDADIMIWESDNICIEG